MDYISQESQIGKRNFIFRVQINQKFNHIFTNISGELELMTTKDVQFKKMAPV